MGTVTIITGEMNEGKTAKLINLFNEQPAGTAAGFASVKFFADAGGFRGYRLRKLVTNQEFPFILLKDQYKGEFPQSFVFDRFVFSETAIAMGAEIIRDALSNPNIQAIFMDEIGPVELQGKGFCAELGKVLAGEKDLYICVNRGNLEQVTEGFGIAAYRLLE